MSRSATSRVSDLGSGDSTARPNGFDAGHPVMEVIEVLLQLPRG
jgi:hypothetical protein